MGWILNIERLKLRIIACEHKQSYGLAEILSVSDIRNKRLSVTHSKISQFSVDTSASSSSETKSDSERISVSSVRPKR